MSPSVFSCLLVLAASVAYAQLPTISEVRSQPFDWPRQVAVSEPLAMTIYLEEVAKGQLKLASGRNATLKDIQGETLFLESGLARAEVHYSKTDLLQRVAQLREDRALPPLEEARKKLIEESRSTEASSDRRPGESSRVSDPFPSHLGSSPPKIKAYISAELQKLSDPDHPVTPEEIVPALLRVGTTGLPYLLDAMANLPRMTRDQYRGSAPAQQALLAAAQKMASHATRDTILSALPLCPGLALLIEDQGWEYAAQPSMLQGVREMGLKYLWDAPAFRVACRLHDPTLLPALQQSCINWPDATNFCHLLFVDGADPAKVALEAWAKQSKQPVSPAHQRDAAILAAMHGNSQALAWLFSHASDSTLFPDPMLRAAAFSAFCEPPHEDLPGWCAREELQLQYSTQHGKYLLPHQTPTPSAWLSPEAATDPRLIAAIPMPPADREAEEHFISSVLKQVAPSSRPSLSHPCVLRLAQLGSERLPALLKALYREAPAQDSPTTARGQITLFAISLLAAPEHRNTILSYLPVTPSLMGIVLSKNWIPDTTDILWARSRYEPPTRWSAPWQTAVSLCKDPRVSRLLSGPAE